MGWGCPDKNQHLVMNIGGIKVQLMYQKREKFNSLNSLMTSSAKRQWQSKVIIAEVTHYDH